MSGARAIQFPPRAGDDGNDESTRVRLGASPGTPAPVLLALAKDRSVTVRAALALNPSMPGTAYPLLARDADERVRILLARRLACLAPDLNDAERTELNRQAVAALAHLVEDETTRVRAAIAEAIKEMPDAPRELVLRLAHDTAVEVSDPVIRLSPVLTQADLLALLAGAGSPAVALAVARRPGLSAAVADAIAASTDVVAIRALLMNHSAQIRESTLDALISRAAEEHSWHEPLVRRPHLSASAAAALSNIVADTLLAELANRADLPPRLVAELRGRLVKRLASRDPEAPAEATPPPQGESQPVRGTQVTETALLAAVARGDSRQAMGMLAMAANVPLEVVERASSMRSAKGLVSLIWKAGYSMRAAVPVQVLLGRLAPGAMLVADAGAGGGFPLSIEEMRWQIAFLGRKQP